MEELLLQISLAFSVGCRTCLRYSCSSALSIPLPECECKRSKKVCRIASPGYELGFIQLFLELVLKARYNKNSIAGLQLLVLKEMKALSISEKVANPKKKKKRSFQFSH